MAARIDIYSKTYCPYCTKAKALLERLGLSYTEYMIDLDPKAFERLRGLTSARTVPQIFINGLGVGGCDDLYALQAEGKLDPLTKES